MRQGAVLDEATVAARKLTRTALPPPARFSPERPTGEDRSDQTAEDRRTLAHHSVSRPRLGALRPTSARLRSLSSEAPPLRSPVAHSLEVAT